MRRTEAKTLVDRDRNLYRYTTRLESEECEPNSKKARFIQYELLGTLSWEQSLTRCGSVQFASLKMNHNGKAWVVECIAEVEEPRDLA